MTDNNAPGVSPIYAVAASLLERINRGSDWGCYTLTQWQGNVCATIERDANRITLTLYDDTGAPLHDDALAAWAAGMEQALDWRRTDNYAVAEWVVR